MVNLYSMSIINLSEVNQSYKSFLEKIWAINKFEDLYPKEIYRLIEDGEFKKYTVILF